jgi:hypothetical protein
VIAEQPLPINAASFNAMKKVIKFNSRFTQGKLGEGNIIERAFAAVKKREQPTSATVANPPKSTGIGADIPPQPPTEIVSTIYASTLQPEATSTAAAAADAQATQQAKEGLCKRAHGEKLQDGCIAA